jgi:hypothetical protein
MIGALSLAACAGTGAEAAPTATPAPGTLAGAEDPPARPSGEIGWRTDLPVGGIENQVAEATQVLLLDGSEPTLEALADGKPLLLYFYATW